MKSIILNQEAHTVLMMLATKNNQSIDETLNELIISAGSNTGYDVASHEFIMGKQGTIQVEIGDTQPRIRMRLRTDEIEACDTIAAHYGYKNKQAWIVQLIRSAVLHQPFVSPTELGALAASDQQLIRIGNNLNQIAKAINNNPSAIERADGAMILDLNVRLKEALLRYRDVLKSASQRWLILKGRHGKAD